MIRAIIFLASLWLAAAAVVACILGWYTATVVLAVLAGGLAGGPLWVRLTDSITDHNR
jgi:hypothetical protein